MGNSPPPPPRATLALSSIGRCWKRFWIIVLSLNPREATLLDLEHFSGNDSYYAGTHLQHLGQERFIFLGSFVEKHLVSQARRHGGGGGGNCLSAERSVMSMMMIPLPHYDNFWRKKNWSRKKCVGVPPPPPHSPTFCPPYKQTPWRRPVVSWFLLPSNCMHVYAEVYKINSVILYAFNLCSNQFEISTNRTLQFSHKLTMCKLLKGKSRRFL